MINISHYDELKTIGVLAESLDLMLENEPEWTEKLVTLVHQTQVNTILDPKLVILIRLCIDVTATHLYESGIQRHIQQALKLGIHQSEILEVFKLASVVGIHSCALGVPILKNELIVAGISEAIVTTKAFTPICDEMKLQGNFNPLWETLYEWDPVYLEDFLKMATHAWTNGILPPLWIELLCIAGDATITHMWAPGTQRHMQAALALGASSEQILAVLKIVSLQGIEACELGSTVLKNLLKENTSS